jgi:hypothetical protein
MHFACANGFSKFCHAFFGWGFILGRDAYRWSPSFGRCPCCFGILFSCVIHWPSYFTWTIPPFSFLSLLASFNKKVMQIYGDIIGPKSWEFFQGPLRNVRLDYQYPLVVYAFLYGGLCPICFFGELGSGGSLFVI